MNAGRPPMVSLLLALSVGCGGVDPPGGGGGGGGTGGGSSSGAVTVAATGTDGSSSGGGATQTGEGSSGAETGDPSTSTSTGGGSSGTSSGGGSESSGAPERGPSCAQPEVPWEWEGWPSTAMWGSGPEEVWSVDPALGALRRYDGATWKVVDVGIAAFLPVSVTGSGADEIYVAASDGLVIRYDGAWQPDGEVMAAPVLAATGPGTVIAVGDGDTVMVREEGLWQPQALPLEASLHGAAGGGPDHVFAVGEGGTALFWDGFLWIELASPTVASLRGAAMLTEESAVAVGDGGVILRLEADGITSMEPLPAPYTKLGMRGVWATDDRVFAISVQSLHYFDGEAWSTRFLPFFDSSAAVWAASAHDVHVGGLQHASLHCRVSP